MIKSSILKLRKMKSGHKDGGEEIVVTTLLQLQAYPWSDDIRQKVELDLRSIMLAVGRDAACR